MRSSFRPDLTFCTAIKSKRARILATLAPWQKFTLIAIVIVALVGLSYTIIRPASGEILDGEDNDFFTFNYSGNAWDLIAIVLQNKSTTLRPWINVYDADKSQTSSKYDNIPGANVNQVIAAAPQTTYYVKILPYDIKGKHTLSIEPNQTWDEFAPNEDAFSAVDIGGNKRVVANIMGSQNNDWCQLNAGAVDTISVRLKNRSTTLRPWLEVYNRNKFEILSQYDNTPGSDLEVSFKVVAGESYFIQVRPLSAAEQHLL
tara:strand:- start:54344 stop:55120 length:777 start_codon:yes stop_codon:yes gene_type:complete